MRAKTQLFTVNGQPLLAPDTDVILSYTDVEGMPAVRDQDGVLHRSVVRDAVAQWRFSYLCLTEAERQYLEGLFPAGGETFVFGHPDRNDLNKPVYTTCYRDEHTLALRDARGLWRNCGFRIREV